MQQLLGLTIEEIQIIIKQMHAPSFVAQQICEWVYNKGVTDIMSMSNISLKLRKELKRNYIIGITPYIKEVISKDTTKKYLFKYSDGVLVEAVLIFDGNRITLCISTQVGCKMNCSFCATGKMGFLRNLTSNEIINIYRCLDVGRWIIKKEDTNDKMANKISNIVFMGMGEPLDNFEQLRKTLDILTSKWGYAFSPRRITVSTCGYMPKMREFLELTNTDVAISLHNAIKKEREIIMPIEKVYSITKVVQLLKQYDWSGQRHLTFEYIVFKNLNDSDQHIKSLAKLLNGLACRINLIPFNTIPNSPFIGVGKEEMSSFAQKLKAKGFNATVRQSKGQDILAACGLLATKGR
ncbi:MAG: 23S rRNA (adenine(2503)-C(2))-methyltransferase RlmN [Bacteroidales bacterium]